VKILYVSQYFPPEMGAPAARAAELARHWSLAAQEVSVLTGFPNHPTGVLPAEWRGRLKHLTYHERAGLVDVFRTWLWPLPNRKAHERMRNYASFCLSAGLRGLSLPRPDVIIASSPQLLVGLAGWWLAFSRQIPFVFEVRDLWPESLAAVGVSGEDSVLSQTLGAIAGFLYEHADHIVVVTPAFRQYLVERWHVPADRISVVENGVEAELFAPASAASDQALRDQLRVHSEFLVAYIGTMGHAHGLETVLAAAAALARENANLVFLLVGEGAEKDRLQGAARALGLENVRFLDQQPREKIPALISAADACLVLLKRSDIFRTVIPTKMLEFMACARPVILGVDGQARQIVEGAEAGLAIEPENWQALVKAVKRLQGNRALAVQLGQNGRKYIVENLSRRSTAEKYLQVLRKLVPDSKP
jgi:colanic acid biosynthesis glycosyl transferase WcaI